jgi:hypothetical protein
MVRVRLGAARGHTQSRLSIEHRSIAHRGTENVDHSSDKHRSDQDSIED